MSMKHINSTGMALLLGVTVICAAAQLARGAEGREGKLFITGEANAMAEYDMAKVTVSITAEEKNTSVVGTAAIAQSKHSEAVQSLVSLFLLLIFHSILIFHFSFLVTSSLHFSLRASPWQTSLREA